jgi:hypothetical protein
VEDPNKFSEGSKLFLPFRGFRTGLFSDVSACDSYPLCILDFVELRVTPLIRHEKTASSQQSLQKMLAPCASLEGPHDACRSAGGGAVIPTCFSGATGDMDGEGRVAERMCCLTVRLG